MRIVVLATRGASTNILLNRLVDWGYDDVRVLYEEPVSKLDILRYRMRRLGILRALDQLLFVAFASTVLRRLSARRTQEILEDGRLSADDCTCYETIPMRSANDPQTIQALRNSGPDVVLVNGTRILRSDVLKSIDVPFLNIHAGITPAYRGVHGGYWALRADDAANCGATLHLVDAGVDTGTILAQSRIVPGPKDSFATYPMLQLASILPALRKVLDLLEQGLSVPTLEGPVLPSQQWFHPGLSSYLWGVLYKGVH
ncbi:MAG: formyl transferase [Pseudomonadota bacterium]